MPLQSQKMSRECQTFADLLKMEVLDSTTDSACTCLICGSNFLNKMTITGTWEILLTTSPTRDGRRKLLAMLKVTIKLSLVTKPCLCSFSKKIFTQIWLRILKSLWRFQEEWHFIRWLDLYRWVSVEKPISTLWVTNSAIPNGLTSHVKEMQTAMTTAEDSGISCMMRN